MPPTILITVIVAYFTLLLGIAFYTSRSSNNESFFIGNRSSKWWVVAFGMVGTSLSGITFISVPGTVGTAGFSYFEVVLGYVAGYFAVAYILLPLYYKLHLTSIYTYLDQRFGKEAYKTGAIFFLISRTLGATLRLYLVIKVLQEAILNSVGIPFWVTAVTILVLILLYTYRGGVKTIIWTDMLQTTFMLLALLICTGYILSNLQLGVGEAWKQLTAARFTHMTVGKIQAPDFFLKQFVGGSFITIGMTGLDQEMMQKNISVNTLRNAQKIMIAMSILQAVAVFVFLSLGGLLYLFCATHGGVFSGEGGARVFSMQGHVVAGDAIFPLVAIHYLPPLIGILFVVGLVSALFPSADGALTALTSSFCIDILGLLGQSRKSDVVKTRTRKTVHYSFAALFLICVFLFRIIDNGSIVQLLLLIAGYTYGPLLALFAFGIFTKRKLKGLLVPLACIAGPVVCYCLKAHETLLCGYHIGTELLVINATITFALLTAVSRPDKFSE